MKRQRVGGWQENSSAGIQRATTADSTSLALDSRNADDEVTVDLPRAAFSEPVRPLSVYESLAYNRNLVP